jgi:hypothetical protein
MTVSFAVQKLFSLMQSRLFIVSLNAEPFEFSLGSNSPYFSVPGYFLLLPEFVSKFQALY